MDNGPYTAQIQGFDFLPRPGSPTQKLQTGTDAGIQSEAADGNPSSQLVPSIVRQYRIQHLRKRDAVKRIPGVLRVHGLTCNLIQLGSIF
jgi:hypothetical protein